jgi:hypothetical protein
VSFWDKVGDVYNSVPTPGRWIEAVIDIAIADEDEDRGAILRNRLNSEPSERVLAKAVAQPGIKQAVEGWAWTFSHGVARPLSTAVQVADRDEDIGVREAWKNSEHLSPFQAVATGILHDVPGYDSPITYRNAHQFGAGGDRYNPVFSLSTGAFDAALNWFADPLVVAGKGAKYARKAATETKKGDLAALGVADTTVLKGRKSAVRSEFEAFIRDTDGYTSSELIHARAFKDAPELAALFAKTSGDHATKALIWRTAMGDGAARDALRARRADVAAQMETLTADLDDLVLPTTMGLDEAIGLEASGGLLVDAPTRTSQSVRDQLDQLTEQLDYYDRALGGPQGSKTILDEDQVGIFGSQSGRARMRRADEKKIDRYRAFTVQDGLGGIPVRVMRSPVDRRPQGWIPLHDAAQAVTTMDQMVRRVRDLAPETRVKWMDSIVNAQDDAARGLAIGNIENQIFAHIGRQLNYTRDEIDFLLRKMQQERGTVLSKMKGQSYSGGVDETGKPLDVIVHEDGTATHRGLYETHLDNSVPTLDVDAIYRVLKTNSERVGALRAGSEKAWYKTEEGLDTLNELWKFSVLFRGGYLLRNITDSQIRLISYLGAVDYARSQFENLSIRIGEKLPGKASWQAHGLNKRIQQIDDQLAGKSLADDEVAALREERDGLTEYLSAVQEGRRRFGKGEIKVGDYDVADAFGRTNEEYVFHTKQVSSEETFLELARSANGRLLRDMRGSGDWKTKMGDADGWEDDYLRVVNHQIRQSEIATLLLKGDSARGIRAGSPEDVARWLRGQEGRALRRRLVHKGDTPEELVEAGWQNILHLVPDEGYRAVLGERAFDAADVRAMFGDNHALRPPVNADQVAWSLGQGKPASIWAETRDRYFKWANALPEDVLGRHPAYRQMYRGRLKQLINQADETTTHLTREELDVLETQARRWARREMKRIMFDVSSKSNLGHFVRFINPFYSAWEDTLTKYGRLVMRDPSLVPHAWMLWAAPNESSFFPVVDEDGNPITDEGVFGSDEFIVMPSSLLPGAGDTFSDARISKKSMNLVLQGDPWWLPGFGPLAQVPVNEYVKSRPSAADAAKTILPYGTEEQSWRLLLPATLKNKFMPSDDAARIKVMIAQTEAMRWRQGLRDKKPTDAEIEDRFKSYSRLRWFTSLVSPVSVQYQSPYQFYIDESHRYDEKYGLDADRKFYEKYGDDFYKFRASLSKNVTGIRPSLRADQAAGRVKDLIAKHPEYGWFFVGPDNVGDFNRNVYVAQQIRPTGPLSDTMYRESYSAKEALSRSNAELGWIQYQKLDAQISTEMERLGITDLRQKGGEPLLAVKRQWMDWARQQEWGRDWLADFETRDDGRVRKFLEAAQLAVTDKRLAGRPDIQAMNEYLTNRAKLQQVLAARKAAGGAITLTAKANADLAAVWSGFIAYLKDRYVQFGDVYSRELENDDMTAKVGG